MLNLKSYYHKFLKTKTVSTRVLLIENTGYAIGLHKYNKVRKKT